MTKKNAAAKASSAKEEKLTAKLFIERLKAMQSDAGLRNSIEKMSKKEKAHYITLK